MLQSSRRGSPSPVASCQHTRLLFLTSYSTSSPLPLQTETQHPQGFFFPPPWLVQQNTNYLKERANLKGGRGSWIKQRNVFLTLLAAGPAQGANWSSSLHGGEGSGTCGGCEHHLVYTVLPGRYPQGSETLTSPCLALCLCF